MKTLIILLTSTLLLSVSTFAQKVKIKKDIATVEGVEYADLSDCNGQTCTIKSLMGENILVMHWESFEKPNPIKRNPKSKAPYHPTVTERYSIIKFFGSDIEFESKLLSKKHILRELYNDNVIDSSGKVSNENVEVFMKKHARDISSKRPQVIIVR